MTFQHTGNLLYGWHTWNKVSCNPCPSGTARYTLNSTMPSNILLLRVLYSTKHCIHATQCWLKPSLPLPANWPPKSVTQGHNVATPGISTNDRKMCSDACINANSYNSWAYTDNIWHIRLYHILYYLQWSHRKWYVKFLHYTNKNHSYHNYSMKQNSSWGP